MNNKTAQNLVTLFFLTRQIVRARVPSKIPDPNAWLRFETLQYIALSRDPTMHDVARHLRVQAPSATSLIGNLARKGYIARRGSPSDKRIVRIRLTKRGRGALATYGKCSASRVREVFAKLDAEDIRTLAGILHRLQDIHRAEENPRYI
jgi:DNA-binding MarR family transcriptional regulator